MSQPNEGGQVADGGATLEATEVAPAASVDVSAGQSMDGASTDSGTSGQVSSNWKPLLEAVPEQFHSVAIPTLEKWDKSYNEMAQHYAPYKKQFEDQGVTMDTLSNAYRLFDMVSKNPQTVFQNLAGALAERGIDIKALIPGLLEAKAQAEADAEEEDNSTEPVDPNLKKLQDQMAQQQQWIEQSQTRQQQEAYQQQVQNAERELDNEIKAIQAKDANLNLQDLFSRYSAQLAMADQATRNGQQNVPQPSITRAYEEQQAFIQSIRGTAGITPVTPTTNPPKVMPSGGSGIPGNTTQTKPETPDDRARKIQAIIMASQQ